MIDSFWFSFLQAHLCLNTCVAEARPEPKVTVSLNSQNSLTDEEQMKISGEISKFNFKKNQANQISPKHQTAGILHLFFDVPFFKAQNR